MYKIADGPYAAAEREMAQRAPRGPGHAGRPRWRPHMEARGAFRDARPPLPLRRLPDVAERIGS